MDFVIFTCDDILKFKLLEIFKSILAEMDIDFINLYKIYPKSLRELKKICNDNAQKIIFVDINNKMYLGGDWIKCLSELSEKYSNLKFVIISRSEVNAGVIFKNNIRVKYFINQSVDDLENEIKKLIKIIVKEFYDADRYIVAVNNIGNKVKIFYKDIFFIETVKGKHKCIINYSSGVGTLRAGINELMLRLDSRFILCRSSTIANKENILEIDLKNNIFYFKENLSCTFSRSNKRKIKDIIKRELIL